MRSVAHLADADRQELFAETAARLGLRPAIVEKDFWVCLILELLFTESAYKDHLVFKGGTSLSKAYQLIERFSEDIDLILDWSFIGFGERGIDPFQNFPSHTRQDRFNKEVNRLAGELIRDRLCQEWTGILARAHAQLAAAVDGEDPMVVNVHYPAAFAERYIRPEVRLEIGPLASWIPSAAHRITPYAAQVFPAVFKSPSCRVLTIAAERTFWEKATILHAEAHRPDLIPPRYSRHYYDLYRLALSPVRASALSRLDLLEDVVRFKRRFYPLRRARYDLAEPGTLKLVPGRPEQLAALARDYAGMQVMLFGDPPRFQEILARLDELERAINTAQEPAGISHAARSA